MTLPPSPPLDADPDRQLAGRDADLTELLGHLTTCWDDERRQLARKLHDSLGSSMTALTMHLALLTQQLPKEKALQDRTTQMKQLLMTIINTNRDMQLSLWNDKLEFLGITSAIAELVSDFGKEHRVVARCSLPDDDETYAREHGVALLRTLEEGLRNIATHAGATEIDVILDDGGDEIMLTVRDNGVGMGTRSGQSSGCHGLRLLRERAAYLGGALSVMPAQQRGTVMTLTLPKAPHAHTAAGG
ncbi:sensor histidine kinase [Massilia scottii]|uniref:sensor histidine kinase n=1 Tax=Massilia scottii TaxID=3057166 RepID=UPI0027966509|nr:ATP-binding protein [Massilia sp. CCM 9029]MDQ1833044.1 histidine kinase [Massilia sp. CCM 9029]